MNPPRSFQQYPGHRVFGLAGVWLSRELGTWGCGVGRCGDGWDGGNKRRGREMMGCVVQVSSDNLDAFSNPVRRRVCLSIGQGHHNHRAESRSPTGLGVSGLGNRTQATNLCCYPERREEEVVVCRGFLRVIHLQEPYGAIGGDGYFSFMPDLLRIRSSASQMAGLLDVAVCERELFL